MPLWPSADAPTEYRRTVRDRLRLPDGRILAFQQIGAPDGVPVLYFHGSPSSGSEWRLFGTADDIAACGVRLIAADRPGSGGSSFQPGRAILDWPADVVAVASHFCLDHFAVLGYSGGGPYALACALRIPERLTACVSVSGTAPFDVPGATDDINPDSWRFMQLSRSRPMVSRAISWGMGLTARLAPRRMVAQAIRALPPPDAAALADPALGRAFARLVYETTHGSPQGAQHDTALMIGPWGFDPADISIPVTMWHGTEDRNAPPAMARWLAERIPGAKLTWLDDHGHISGAAAHGTAILKHLVA